MLYKVYGGRAGGRSTLPGGLTELRPVLTAAGTGGHVERKVAAQVRAQRWYLRFPRAVPVGIFLLVSAITALSVYAIERVESQRAAAQHRQAAVAVTAAIERFGKANAAYLSAGAALLSTRREVTRADLHQFAEQMGRDDALRFGRALGWAPKIDRAAIPALEQRMRAGGHADYTVHPVSSGGLVLPVIYVEPDVPANSRGFGVDIYADPIRRAAIDRALASGRPAASGPIEVVVDAGSPDQTGFGVFMPVYDVQPGSGQLKGVIARVFNARRFIAAALAPEQLQDYGVTIYDGEQPGRVLLVALGPASASASALAPARASAPASPGTIVRPIMLVEHRMVVEVTPPPAPQLSDLSLLTLLFGMMVAALLLVVARLLTQQALEDREALAWFEEQASIRNSLSRELNHRVKNTLATVLSIVSLTRRRTDNIDEFVTGLIGRVRALSATHDLLTQSEWGTTPVRAVVVAELAPYAQDSDRAVAMRGPNVELAPNDALSLGLAIHELATNAAKYGALSTPAGHVEVAWEMITDKLARIEWSEHGGPPVSATRRRGFGTELIEKIVAHELKNPVDLSFATAGVRCSLIVPVRLPTAFQMRAVGDGGG